MGMRDTCLANDVNHIACFSGAEKNKQGAAEGGKS